MRSLRSLRPRWGDGGNVDLIDIDSEGANWIGVAQGRVHCLGPVTTARDFVLRVSI